MIKGWRFPDEKRNIQEFYIENRELTGQPIGGGGYGLICPYQENDNDEKNGKRYCAKLFYNTPIPRIHKEFLIIYNLHSPFIVQVHHLFQATNHGNSICMVMDRYEGNLEGLIKSKFSNIQAFLLFGTIAHSVYQIHTQKLSLMHHDLTLKNFCIEPFEYRFDDSETSQKFYKTRLIDFNLYKYPDDQTEFAGTQKYRNIDEVYTLESEIYSLGIIFFEILTQTIINLNNCGSSFIRQYICDYFKNHNMNDNSAEKKTPSIQELILSMIHKKKSKRPTIVQILEYLTYREEFSKLNDGFLNGQELNQYFHLLEYLDLTMKYNESFIPIAKQIFNQHYKLFLFSMFHQSGYEYRKQDFEKYQESILQIANQSDENNLIRNIGIFHYKINFFGFQKFFDKVSQNTPNNNEEQIFVGLFEKLVSQTDFYVPDSYHQFFHKIYHTFSYISPSEEAKLELFFGNEYILKFMFLWRFKKKQKNRPKDKLVKFIFDKIGTCLNKVKFSSYQTFFKECYDLTLKDDFNDYQKIITMNLRNFIDIFKKDDVNNFQKVNDFENFKKELRQTFEEKFLNRKSIRKKSYFNNLMNKEFKEHYIQIQFDPNDVKRNDRGEITKIIGIYEGRKVKCQYKTTEKLCKKYKKLVNKFDQNIAYGIFKIENRELIVMDFLRMNTERITSIFLELLGSNYQDILKNLFEKNDYKQLQKVSFVEQMIILTKNTKIVDLISNQNVMKNIADYFQKSFKDTFGLDSKFNKMSCSFPEIRESRDLHDINNDAKTKIIQINYNINTEKIQTIFNNLFHLDFPYIANVKYFYEKDENYYVCFQVPDCKLSIEKIKKLDQSSQEKIFIELLDSFNFLNISTNQLLHEVKYNHRLDEINLDGIYFDETSCSIIILPFSMTEKTLNYYFTYLRTLFPNIFNITFQHDYFHKDLFTFPDIKTIISRRFTNYHIYSPICGYSCALRTLLGLNYYDEVYLIFNEQSPNYVFNLARDISSLYDKYKNICIGDFYYYASQLLNYEKPQLLHIIKKLNELNYENSDILLDIYQNLKIISQKEIKKLPNPKIGGSAYVYKSEYEGETVAIKLIKGPNNLSYQNKFVKEYVICNFLRKIDKYGKYIIDVKAVIEGGIIMKYYPHTLCDFIEKDPRESQFLNFLDKMSIILKLSLVIFCLHKYGLIHRDIKPPNILLNKNKKDVVVSDTTDMLCLQLNSSKTQFGGTILYYDEKAKFNKEDDIKAFVKVILEILTNKLLSSQFDDIFYEAQRNSSTDISTYDIIKKAEMKLFEEYNKYDCSFDFLFTRDENGHIYGFQKIQNIDEIISKMIKFPIFLVKKDEPNKEEEKSKQNRLFKEYLKNEFPDLLTIDSNIPEEGEDDIQKILHYCYLLFTKPKTLYENHTQILIDGLDKFLNSQIQFNHQLQTESEKKIESKFDPNDDFMNASFYRYKIKKFDDLSQNVKEIMIKSLKKLAYLFARNSENLVSITLMTIDIITEIANEIYESYPKDSLLFYYVVLKKEKSFKKLAIPNRIKALQLLSTYGKKIPQIKKINYLVQQDIQDILDSGIELELTYFLPQQKQDSTSYSDPSYDSTSYDSTKSSNDSSMIDRNDNDLDQIKIGKSKKDTSTKRTNKKVPSKKCLSKKCLSKRGPNKKDSSKKDSSKKDSSKKDKSTTGNSLTDNSGLLEYLHFLAQFFNPVYSSFHDYLSLTDFINEIIGYVETIADPLPENAPEEVKNMIQCVKALK
ncbi:hypothetical protein TRFO_28959 [Tritrichomonas foetus]|uniref:Protein kinase domain-containing protein n=1 Tax=Tritrichomonas foetus TaxID=1144522 RepID=A0A1J4JWR5_9EUKA|nr:hypothetical protein TRFO_28959 [Tritrichomonas foetus]|eukprot:OHT03593.1 hypothetical protein TRFO_28959 [Tritrichomonas foetus]